MRITCIAFGTRGDVQPAIALSKALEQSGHQVRVLAGANFKGWIERHGLEAATTGVDLQALMESEGGREWVERGHNPLVQVRVMKKLAAIAGWEMISDAWQACQGAEAIISSFVSDLFAAAIAEKLHARHISMPLQPALIATRNGAAATSAPLHGRVSLLNYIFARLIMEPFQWRLSGDMVNRFRSEVLKLPPQTYKDTLRARDRMLIVHGYSRHVVPHPDDWPPNTHTTGYWFLEEGQGWTPPPGLLAFLEAGAPPICIGFGSMTGRDPEATSRLLGEAVLQSGQRAIVLSGWAGLGGGEQHAHILPLESAPHDWLYPRMAAVIHHGGAGTTAAGLKAGVPSILVPHMADQLFWGKRIQALGVGPAAISRNKLSAPALAAAITQATGDPGIAQRAVALGAAIRAEDGIGSAVRLINSFLNTTG